jgi:ubiquinone/menaquinone biosynthesis C-methylase UbiE
MEICIDTWRKRVNNKNNKDGDVCCGTGGVFRLSGEGSGGGRVVGGVDGSQGAGAASNPI